MKRATVFKEKTITIQDVFTAMIKFDSAPRVGWYEDKKQKYAIENNKKFYPPKDILSIITGRRRSRNGIHGGPPTNRVFNVLDFRIKKIR